MAYGSQTTSSATSFSFSWQSWLVVILLLALLGINIFAYLAKGTQDITTIFYQIFAPILTFFGYQTAETTKQTVQTSAVGAKSGVDVVASGAKSTVDLVASGTTGAIDTITPTNPNNQPPSGKTATTTLPVQSKIQQAGANISTQQQAQQQQDSLQQALNNASKQPEEVNPDDSQSSLYGKAGWCYIGDDNDTRTCSQVGVNDKCMSGDIFPSQDICVNPNLRA